MTDKILISEGEMKGGLTEGTQKYKINFMPKVMNEDGTIKWDEKIEFVLLKPGNAPDKFFYHSLRFTNPEQIRMVAIKFFKAYAYFKKHKGELNPANAHTLPHIIAKEIEQEMVKVVGGGATK